MVRVGSACASIGVRSVAWLLVGVGSGPFWPSSAIEAVLVIAVAYTSELNLIALGVAGGLLGVIAVSATGEVGYAHTTEACGVAWFAADGTHGLDAHSRG